SPLRRPTSATPFPYTTLFRSQSGAARAEGHLDGIAGLNPEALHGGGAQGNLPGLCHKTAPEHPPRQPPPVAVEPPHDDGLARRQIGRAQSELQSRENLVCRLL